MDYFGKLVDDLTDLYESIEDSPHAADASEVLEALQRVMEASVKAERLRESRRALAAEAVAKATKAA